MDKKDIEIIREKIKKKGWLKFDKGTIIDGNIRIQLKDLVNVHTEEELNRYSPNEKAWTLTDFIHYYSDNKKNKNYSKLNKFISEHPELTTWKCITMCSKNPITKQKFMEGLFEFK